jgi:hypothetical protein
MMATQTPVTTANITACARPAGVRAAAPVAVVAVVALVALLLFAGCTEDPPAPPVGPQPADNFLQVPAAECGQCHVTHYAEWQSSMHAYAGTDPLWYAVNAAGQKDTGGQLDQFCVGCHLPAAQLAGLTSMPLDREAALDRPLVREGVGCGFCHSIDRFTGISNREAAFTFATDRRVYGTILHPQTTSYHQAEVRSGMGNSAYCGTCHQLENEAGVTIESTYTEWFDSNYNATGVDCQDCHMPEYQGRATPSSDSLRTLHRHTFVGVDVALEDFPGRDAQIAAVRELLAGAARLELHGKADADSVRVTATVHNEGTGHDLPSGPTTERQLWLEIRVEDGEGAGIFASGELDANGDLKNRQMDPQLALWNSTFLDAQGEETPFMWRANAQESRRIPANGAGEALYRFLRPGSGPLRVHARLLFRAVPPYTLRAHGLDEHLPFLEIFTVDEAEITIALSSPKS